jgi:hypothetical protein
MTVKKMDTGISPKLAVDHTDNGVVYLVKLASDVPGSSAMIGGSYPLVSMDIEHSQIHDGTAFVVRGWADIADETSPRDILIVTPSTGFSIHFVWKFSGEGEMTISLYEDVVTSNDGTPQTEICMRREEPRSPGVEIFISPTVTSTGTLLFSDIIGSGRSSSGELDFLRGLLFKKGAKYMFRVTKITGGTLWLNHHIQWYEPANEV